MKRIVVVMTLMVALLFGAQIAGLQTADAGPKWKKIRTVAGCKARFRHRKGKRRSCKACVRRGGKFKKKGGVWFCKF